MHKKLTLILHLLLLCLNNVFSDTDRLGFGLQPGIIQPSSDPRTLTKRILSTTKYKLTPGDSYELVIIIEETERYPLMLADDYLLSIPYIGTINVRGMYFSDLRRMIVQKIEAKVPVQFVDFTLTSPALFDVFIYGGIKKPGIATINPISRISDAIILGGGLMDGASFRTIELIRKGSKEILDLSRFASQADFSQNPMLEPEDRIYIPQAECIVEITGKVKYPGIYELLPDETLEDLLIFAGGTTSDAESQELKITRISSAGKPMVFSVKSTEKTELLNADKIHIASLLENREMITLDGALYGSPTSGETPTVIPEKNIMVNLPYIPGMTLLEVLKQMGGPTPLADTDKSYIKHRESGKRITTDVRELWETRNPQIDITLKPGDLVVIPMKKMEVIVAGQVNSPDSFPYVNGYKVHDYIMAAGGIDVDTGSKNSIFYVDELGKRKKVLLDAMVTEPGTLIFVGKNTWTHTTKTLADILIVTNFIAALITLTNSIISFAGQF